MPRLKFSVLPPPKSNNDSHASDGVIGTTNMKSTRATSKKARKNSSQNVNEELLASEVNAVLIDKGKKTKQPGGKKNKKGKNKKREESSPEKSFANPSGQSKPPVGVIYVMRIIGREIVHRKLKVKKLFKSSKTSAVFIDPFPNPGTKVVANQNASRSQVLMLSISKQQNDALTRSKD